MLSREAVVTAPPARQDFVKNRARASMFRQDGAFGSEHGSTVRKVPGIPGMSDECGGPMTVVAGIVALLLLGYLVVALLKPERF